MSDSTDNDKLDQDRLFTDEEVESLFAEAPDDRRELLKTECRAVEKALIEVMIHIAEQCDVEDRIGYNITPISPGVRCMHPIYKIGLSSQTSWFGFFKERNKGIMHLTIAETGGNYADWEVHEREYWDDTSESIMKTLRERLLQIRNKRK
jgi:hypothetical protein